MALWVVAAAALIGSLAYMLVLALDGAQLVRIALPGAGTTIVMHDAVPWLIAAVVAAVASLGAWALAERQLADLPAAEADGRDARAKEKEARERLRQVERERDKIVRKQTEERVAWERMSRAWRNEREWNRELRGQIDRLQRAQGVLGRHDDMHRMVLELTLRLVDAEKGLLLSDHETSENRRQVVCFSGFDNDPQDSAIAQRFADEVIERDRTVREDDTARVQAEKRTAADEEVDNLLAIPLYLSDNFAGVIVCANRDGGFKSLEDEVLLAIGDHAGAVLQNFRLHGDLRSAYLSTIRVLADAIELKDPDLRGHSDAVSEYVLAVADRLDFEPRRREELIFASLLHDVGKLGISERILLKPAGLTAEERSIIQLHPRIGYQLVSQVPALREIAPAILHHHERFDGEGYPGRLRGETIPLEARIIAIADAFSAIISDRPYSAAKAPEEACAELERCAGSQFDPEVVRYFVEEVRRRSPQDGAHDSERPNPELDVHRLDGEFKLGARSFGITDSLTLLYSHRHFHESVGSAAQRAALQNRPFAIVVAQLVGIDQLNRSQGFLAGDELLQSTAAIMQKAAARRHGQGFRASGRRLALLWPGLDQATAEQATDEVRQELQISLAGSEVDFTLGMSVWRPGEDGEAVIGRAMLAARAAVPA